MKAFYEGKFTEYEKIKGRKALHGPEELAQWMFRSSIFSNSLSTVTQLLLLSHAPVSRKVFQFFHCHDLEGVRLLRADYAINCDSNEYYAFLPVVVCVMLGFTFGLPTIISFYLIRHRHELYTARIYEQMGWLYHPFMRGAEAWHVHDVVLKMLLTGMLIYIPNSTRAGVAVLICSIASCNLNYFRPHKNKLIFWYSQATFMGTLIKYTLALLLPSSTLSLTDREAVFGNLLLSVDIFIMVFSVVVIFILLHQLRRRARHLKSTIGNAEEGALVAQSSTGAGATTKIVPSPNPPSTHDIDDIREWK